MQFPFNEDQVRRHTSTEVNRWIDRRIEDDLTYCSRQSPEALPLKIKELNNEWDIERALETNAAIIAFGGNFAWFLRESEVAFGSGNCTDLPSPARYTRLPAPPCLSTTRDTSRGDQTKKDS